MRRILLGTCALAAAVLGYMLLSGSPPHRPAGTIVIDCSCTTVLDEFNDDRSLDALFRHLCASSRWRVTRNLRTKMFEAERRGDKPRTLDEWHAPGRNRTVGVTLIFGFTPEEQDRGRTDQRYSSFGEPGDCAVRVAVRPAVDASKKFCSRTVIEGKRIVLSVAECNLHIERMLTKEVMEHVCEELTAVRQNLAVVEGEGYLRQWIPQGSILESAHDLPLDIQPGSQSGIYWLSGYVNPQEKGYLTIRAYETLTGIQSVGGFSGPDDPDTVEYVGWSEKPSEKFFFESQIVVPGDRDERSIRLEVWFHGKNDRKLLEKTTLLLTWSR